MFHAARAALESIGIPPQGRHATIIARFGAISAGTARCHLNWVARSTSLSLRLEAIDAHPGEALLAFGPDTPPSFAEVAWLSRSANLAEAAANLFAMLRELDSCCCCVSDLIELRYLSQRRQPGAGRS